MDNLESVEFGINIFKCNNRTYRKC